MQLHHYTKKLRERLSVPSPQNTCTYVRMHNLHSHFVQWLQTFLVATFKKNRSYYCYLEYIWKLNFIVDYLL